MKKILIISMLLILSMFTYGCKAGEEEVIEINKTEEALKYIKELNGFKAKARITYYTDSGEQTFEMIQEGTKDGKYKIEIISPENLVGNISINDGESLYQINENRSKQIYVSTNEYPERVQILITSFIRNFLENNMELSKIGELNNGELIILESTIKGENTYFATEQLTIDGNTYSPIKMDIYRVDTTKFVEVEYLEFSYNPSFSEGYFSPMINK